MSKNITIDTFITDVENHILYNDIKNIILVGHSFSGNVISGLAEKYKDRIKQLIYFDSMVVKGGQTPFDISNSEITKERIKLAEEFDKFECSKMITHAYIYKKNSKCIWTFASYEDKDVSFSDRNVFPKGCVVRLTKLLV